MISKKIAYIGRKIYKKTLSYIGERKIEGRAADGDVHFGLDEIAETAMETALDKVSKSENIAYFSEREGKVETLSQNPEYIFIVDPVDGSRPAQVGFPQWCVSIAVAPYSEDLRVRDVMYAFIKEADGTEHFAEKGKGNLIDGKNRPALSTQTNLDEATLVLDVCGHEPAVAGLIYSPLIQKTSPTGTFVVNSSSWTIAQMTKGRIDGFVNLVTRIYEEFPEYRERILENFGGKLKGLMPYDIAPWYLMGSESGLTLTDSRGRSLEDMKLTDISPENQRCAIVASTQELHAEIRSKIDQRIELLKSNMESLDVLI
jgi:myo-inositol-1(or 4)-monophosphatase